MPTYTYRCDTCGHQFEAVQRFSEDALSECTACGAPIRRVIQPVGVVFKGSGWYITDSRAPQKEAGESESKPAATKEDGKAKDSGSPAKETSTPTATKGEKPAAKVAAE